MIETNINIINNDIDDKKQKQKERMREYYLKNKEKIKENTNKYRLEHKEKYSEYKKKYYYENPEKYKQIWHEYYKKRCENEPNYKNELIEKIRLRQIQKQFKESKNILINEDELLKEKPYLKLYLKNNTPDENK
jgi:hypothetical protein